MFEEFKMPAKSRAPHTNEIVINDFDVQEHKERGLIAIFINDEDIKLPVNDLMPFEYGMQENDLLIINNGIIIRFKNFTKENYAWIKKFRAFSVLYKSDNENHCFALKHQSTLN